MPEPILILHGGTGAKNPSLLAAIRGSLPGILDRAYEVLLRDGALEAVAEAVRLLEDDEIYNAGTGGKIQKDGKSRLSSAVMDGRTQTFAGVVNVEEIKNPVLVAKLLLRERNRVLSGAGAQEFALSRGFKKESTVTPAALEAWRKKAQDCDTVGAVALDAQGNLAAATSTGGIGGETPGRVSDSCTPAGNYADVFSAVSCTGIGEEILDESLASRIAALAPFLGLEAAVRAAFEGVRARKRAMGAIALDREGRIFMDTTAPVLTWAWKKGKETAVF